MQTPDHEARTGGDPSEEKSPPKKPVTHRGPSIIVACIVVAIAALSIWYLVRPEPLLIQGEVDATRLDIAARVDGRVAEIPVVRGQNVAAGAVLVRIDNPETLAKLAAGACRQGRRRSATGQYQRGNAGRSHRGTQGRLRARAGGSELCAADFRSNQRAARQGLRPAGAVRSGDRRPAGGAKGHRASNPPTARRSTATRGKNSRLRWPT